MVQRLRAKEQGGGAAKNGKVRRSARSGRRELDRGLHGETGKALERIGPTVHLSAQRLDTLLNRPGIAAAEEEDAPGIRLTAWLDEQESHHQFLIYETDGTLSFLDAALPASGR